MLTWPHAKSDWAPILNAVEEVFVQIAHRIAERQPLLIVCFDKAHKDRIHAILSPFLPQKIDFYIVRSDDTWVRDYGPLTILKDEKKELLDFVFNGWGNKFPAPNDNRVTRELDEQGAFGYVPLCSIDYVLEGGSIEVDGEGTLLTTARCLLAKTRNPHLSRAEIEKKLMTLLGVQRFLWLEHGFLAGDDTDSHIDTLARFTDPNTICYVRCDDEQDEHYAELHLMEAELKNFNNSQGVPYKLVPLPWPSPKYNAQGQRLPATYANFLIINHAVLVPTYQDEKDKVALQRIQSCFLDREVIGIDCTALIQQGGSLHCVTMQLP